MTPKQVEELKVWIRETPYVGTNDYFHKALLKKIEELEARPPEPNVFPQEWK